MVQLNTLSIFTSLFKLRNVRRIYMVYFIIIMSCVSLFLLITSCYGFINQHQYKNSLDFNSMEHFEIEAFKKQHLTMKIFSISLFVLSIIVFILVIYLIKSQL